MYFDVIYRIQNNKFEVQNIHQMSRPDIRNCNIFIVILLLRLMYLFNNLFSKNNNMVGLNMKHLLLQTSMLIDLIMHIYILLFNPRLDHCFQMKVDIWSSFFSKREPE